eukprot:TRINITY_DN2622_c0_g1_i4.p1 TRINITY_DN2622_c0_g1~~TRINITY_DN2622_c0_g1_i4.p1  ORF type:complete len:1359 (+),score=409.19 TRINITY_DN2622_c0_g1_i4:97-4173(+)
MMAESKPGEGAGLDTRKPVGLKHGFLHKQSARFKRWKLCWFVLGYQELRLYGSDPAPTEAPHRTISLRGQCSVMEADAIECKKKYSFKVAVMKKTLVLSAESNDRMEEWVYSIRSLAALHAPPPMPALPVFAAIPTTPSPLFASSPSASSLPPLSAGAGALTAPQSQLLQTIGNVVSLSFKIIHHSMDCGVPGVYEPQRLGALGDFAIKCCAIVRIVVYKQAPSAQQQLTSTLADMKALVLAYSDATQAMLASGSTHDQQPKTPRHRSPTTLLRVEPTPMKENKDMCAMVLGTAEALVSILSEIQGKSLIASAGPQEQEQTVQERTIELARGVSDSARQVVYVAKRTDSKKGSDHSKSPPHQGGGGIVGITGMKARMTNQIGTEGHALNGATAHTHDQDDSKTDMQKLVEASKRLVDNVNVLSDLASSVTVRTGHMQPKATAASLNTLTRDLIATAKAQLLTPVKGGGKTLARGVDGLMTQVRKIAQTILVAEQQYLMELQLLESTHAVEAAATSTQAAAMAFAPSPRPSPLSSSSSSLSATLLHGTDPPKKITLGHSRQQPSSRSSPALHTLTPTSPPIAKHTPHGSPMLSAPAAIPSSASSSSSAAAARSPPSSPLARSTPSPYSHAPSSPPPSSLSHNLTCMAKAASDVAQTLSQFPEAIKELSRSKLFSVAKDVGAATSLLVQVSRDYAARKAAQQDENARRHLHDSIQAVQNGCLQVLAGSKTVISGEFVNQRDLMQLSATAHSFSNSIAHLLTTVCLSVRAQTPSRLLRTISAGGSSSSFMGSSSSSSSASPSLSGSPTQSSLRLSPSVSRLGMVKRSNSAGPSVSSSSQSFMKQEAKTSALRHLQEMVFAGCNDEGDQGSGSEEDGGSSVGGGDKAQYYWTETPDTEEYIIMMASEESDTNAPPAPDGENQSIKAATLNKLIERLTSENNHDIKLQKTFITTYRSFTTPEVLFRRLLQRYNIVVPKLPPAISATEYHKKSVLPIQLRAINVMRQWVDSSFFDLSPDLIAQVMYFADEVLPEDGHVILGRQLRVVVDKRLKEREENERGWLHVSYSANGATQPTYTPASPSHSLSSSLSSSAHPSTSLPSSVPLPLGEGGGGGSQDILSSYTDEEIATHLTLIDFDMYARIKPVELLNQSWSKEELKHRSPNALAMIARFNTISMWASSVLLWQDNIKDRVAVYARLISLADHLFRANNFNTLLAVIAGLNSAPVFRLKHTRAELPKKVASVLEGYLKLMNSECAYKHYREALHNVNPPCVPYLGIYLTDLTFIEDGNKDTVNGCLINFRKRQLVSNIMAEIQLYQQFRYSINEPNEALIQLLTNLPAHDDSQLYQLSLLREPRNASREDIA